MSESARVGLITHVQRIRPRSLMKLLASHSWRPQQIFRMTFGER